MTRAGTIKGHALMKETVIGVLSENSRARNDDRFLILKVLEKMNFDIAITAEGFLWHGDFDDFGRVPAFETITRCRREIQNTDGQWLPTDPTVIIKRGLKEEAIREYYSGSPKLLQDWEQAFYGVR